MIAIEEDRPEDSIQIVCLPITAVSSPASQQRTEQVHSTPGKGGTRTRQRSLVQRMYVSKIMCTASKHAEMQNLGIPRSLLGESIEMR